MEIFEPPEPKCQFVLQPKSVFKDKLRKRRKRQKVKKRELRKLEKEKLNFEDEAPKKDSQREFFELLTNTVKEPPNKGLEKRKIMNKLTEDDLKYIALSEGIDDIEDKFMSKREICDLRRTHGDLSIGDYVLVFPNPDAMKFMKPISFSEAMEIHKTCLTVITDDPLLGEAELKLQRRAFVKAFLSLKDFGSDDLEEQNSKSKKTIMQLKEEVMIMSPKHLNSPEEQGFEAIGPQKIYNEQDFLIGEQKGEQNKLKEIELEKKNNNDDDHQEEKAENPDKTKDFINKLVELRFLENDTTLSNFYQLKVDKIENEAKFAKVKKINALGGYMFPDPIPDSDEVNWICNNCPPNDFMTLLRNAIVAKLTKNAFMHTRSFVTRCGTKIVVVLKADEEMIRREAQLSGIDKQMELGACDLFSLEPVDKKGRPLRMKPYIRKPQFPKDMEEMPDIEKEDRENGVSVSSRAQSLFQKVMKMQDFQLQKLIVNKQARVDVCLAKLAKVLRLQYKKTEDFLEDDNSVEREEWETYYLYMAYLEDFLTRLDKEINPPDKKKERPELKENQYFLYKLIFLKSLGDANEISYLFYRNSCLDFCGLDPEKKKNRLINMWNLLGTEPIPPFMKFTGGGSFWRSYEKNEKGDRSTFLAMEKLKMMHKIISKNINVLKLLKLKYLEACFPLHDNYQMQGEFTAPLFKKLNDERFLLERKDTPGEKRVKQYFMMMADEAEKTDFDTDGSSLVDDIKFNWTHPWEINIESVRNYFGEKIAMYFNFLSFYTLYLMPMGILGIIAQIVIDYAPGLMVQNGMKMAFSFLIIIWSTIFIELWKRKQSLFAVQFGQTNTESAEAERVSFRGRFIRSIYDDDINVLYYSPSRKILRILLSYTISISILVCVVVCVILILYFKDYLNTCGCVDTSNAIVSALPSIINAIQIQIFNAIYQNVGLALNEFENHKFLSQYENSLVFKVFAFTFVNTFNSLVIISFMSALFPGLDICKVSTTGEIDCFEAVAVQMKTLFLVAFVKNIPEILVPFLKLYQKRKNKKVSGKVVEHPFYQIDQKIEEQLEKEPYAANLEVDGTVADYMELVIQFGFLCLFAVNFPICFFLAFITNIAEIQVDKLKIVHFARRPVPENAKDLGTWFLIIDFMSFLSIFFNAALIAYTSSCIYMQDSTTKNKVFVLFVFFFLAIKYIIKILIDDVPYKTRMVENRHQFIKDRVEMGLEGSAESAMRAAKIQLEIEGVANSLPKQIQLDDDLRKLIETKTIMLNNAAE